MAIDEADLDNSSEVMDRRLATLAGPGAVNCGHVAIDADPHSASSCAVRAWQKKEPFYVRYDFRGIDSQVADGLAGNASGQVYGIVFDSMGFYPLEKTRDSASAHDTMPDGSHTVVQPCPKPVKLRIAGNGQTTCFSKRHPFLLADQE